MTIKSSRLILVLIATVTLCLNILSCKKDSTNNSPSNSIVGKWKIGSYVYWKTSGGSATKETVDLTSSDSYEDFRSDGKAYEKFLELGTSTYYYDTATYNLSGNILTTLDVHGRSVTNKLENQTANSMTMHTTLVNGTSQESWFYLTK